MTAGPVTARSESPVLALESLSIGFRVRGAIVPAVTEVDLTLWPGETVTIVGESGSGKSTTAAAVNRLLADNAVITGGRVLVAGDDVNTLSSGRLQQLRGAGIGLVPQDPMTNLNPVMRVGEQIAEALEVHGLAAGPEANRRAVELLDVVGIDDPARRAHQWPHELSGGMRQRVLIAIGLACRPTLLIADEPTSALDVTVQRRILDTIAELTDELGTAVLLITHDLALAAERSDRIAVMQSGRIVELGPAGQVMRAPAHEYTRRLIAASPALRTSSRGSPSAGPEPTGSTAHDPLPPLVATDTVTKVFPGRRGTAPFTAVDGISIEIARGSTVALVGESGSGKSTMANLILGLDRPTTGTISIGGEPRPTAGAALKAFRRRVQPVFQNPYASLDPRYPVGRSITEPMAVHRIGDRTSRRRRAAELLEQVALPADVIDRRPHQLSGGQRQRVAIARALALEPELVVLDEAVSALDVIVQAQILELLDRLQTELGVAYLFISHDLAVVDRIADHAYVMRRGQVVEDGPPAELFTSPRHEYTRELLAAIPKPA